MSKSLRFSVLCCFAFICFSATLSAKKITIYRAGIPLSSTYATLTAAVSASVTGDSLVLSADTFKETNVVIGKNIVLKGTFTADKDSFTVIDGMNTPGTRVISVVSASSVTLLDMTITGGNADGTLINAGGGIYAAVNTTLTIGGKSVICNNHAKFAGGGVYAADLVIKDSASIKDNISDSLGGGIYANGNIATIKNGVTIMGNIAKRGAGICWSGKPVISIMTIEDNVMIGYNTAAITGGGIFTVSTLVITDHVWIGKNSSDFGGGILSVGDPTINLVINGNVMIDSNNAGTAGGAIFNFATTMEIDGGQMVGNQAGAGAAIYNNTKTSSSSAILVSLKNARIYNPLSPGVRQNEIYSNYDGGGAVSVTTEQCWWGQKDTAKLTVTKPGNYITVNNWVVATWSINGAASVSGLTSFPVKAIMELNIGGSIPTGSFPLLSGTFSADLGSFAVLTDTISGSNEIMSTYKSFIAPPDSSVVNFIAIIDGDTFKDSRMVTAATLAVKEVAGINSVKIHPNPVQDMLTIDDAENNSRVVMYDITGRVTGNWLLTANAHSISLKDFVPGTYILELINPAGEKGTARVIKTE